MKREEILNFGLRFDPSSFITGSNFKRKLRGILCESEWTQDLYKTLRGDAPDCPSSNTDGNLSIASEQALNPSSRVSLGRETDKFGMRRAVVDWRLSQIDKRTIQSTVRHFGETFASLGLGRVCIAGWLIAGDPQLPGLSEDEVAGYHHLCTTRMAQSPSEGVVDQHHKIFGIDNFYLAGSSVFTNAGHANPTFTIVQMTLRLAGHLKNNRLTGDS